MKKLGTILAATTLVVGGVSASIAPVEDARATEISVSDMEQAAKAMRASTPVTEQLHDSLPATTTTVSYVWSDVRCAPYKTDDLVDTGYKSCARWLTGKNSNGTRRIAEVQWTGNSCERPNSRIWRLSVSQTANKPNGTDFGYWSGNINYTSTGDTGGWCNWTWTAPSTFIYIGNETVMYLNLHELSADSQPGVGVTAWRNPSTTGSYTCSHWISQLNRYACEAYYNHTY